jgi:hypothetical protein
MPANGTLPTALGLPVAAGFTGVINSMSTANPRRAVARGIDCTLEAGNCNFCAFACTFSARRFGDSEGIFGVRRGYAGIISI